MTLPRQPACSGTADLSHVDCWIFDLDNTLYPSRCNLFDQIDRRMGDYIRRQLDLEQAEAKALQKRYFREYGTTLRGLMSRHGIDAGAYLDYVHDIDLSILAPAPELDAALSRLEGRKLIFTNASTGHAERVLERLGLARHFSDIFDIVASDYIPKPRPAPYQRLLSLYGIDPTRSAMFEDMARNLAPAHALGMTTVWIPGKEDWSAEGAEENHIHHVTEDLAGWLGGLVLA